MKPYDILKLKNSVVNSLHYVRAYIMPSLVIFQTERHVFVLDSLFTASQLSILKALVPLQLIYPPNMYLLVYTHK